MSTKQRLLVASLVGVGLVAGGVWFFVRGKGLVDETRGLQVSLLAGDLKGRDHASGVTQVIRNIDKMNREDVKTLRDAFMAVWRRLRRQGTDEYHAAGEADRASLLDRDIGRLVTAGELWFATNPRSSGQPPNRRTPKNSPQKAAKAKENEVVQRFDLYRAALLGRAKARGIAVPDWLLDVPPR